MAPHTAFSGPPSLPLWVLLAAGFSYGCLGTTSGPGEGPSQPVDPSGPLSQIGTEIACGSKGFALHRLNRTQYDNTLRDLLGDDSRPSSQFPADGQTEGFDNNQEHLALSPLLVEKYEQVATALADAAWAREMGTPVAPSTPSSAASVKVEAETATATVGAPRDGFWNLWSVGEISATFQLAAGTYRIAVRAYGEQIPPEPARFELKVDGAVNAVVDVPALAAAPGTYERTVTLNSPGQHIVAVRFVNDFQNPSNPQEDRNLLVDWISVASEGAGGTITSAGPARLKTCDPSSGETACFRQILERFVRRAWRRPAIPEELDGLQGLLPLVKAKGDGFDVAMKLALRAVLLSPHFVFRVDLSSDPHAPTTAPLNEHALAARLSYFLWGTMPDDALATLADRGTLRATLEPEVRRMLADPRSDSLVQRFGGQWLQAHWMDGISPDPQIFPSVDSVLKTAMKEEVEAFFRHFLREDVSALDMLDAPFSFVNDRLADHYKIPRPGSSSPQRVSLNGTQRAGILTQAGVLAVTSLPGRTSLVKRGKWVLGRLLCQEPPPPPPNVEALANAPKPNATLRERVEAHRSQPSCAGCHRTMDPIGFALEHFDAVGAWRDQDNGAPIDASGDLPGGRTFNGAVELGAVLKADPALPHCMAEQAYGFALGRTVRPEDVTVVKSIADRFGTDGYRFSALFQRLAQSPAFTLSCEDGGAR
jgi:hypothetical protein